MPDPTVFEDVIGEQLHAAQEEQHEQGKLF